MCTYSMVVGHFHDRFPQFQQFPPALYPDFSELVRKARLYDEMMKQRDCPDPVKEEWQKKLEQFMREKYGMEPSPKPSA